jgi:hypothetical protein
MRQASGHWSARLGGGITRASLDRALVDSILGTAAILGTSDPEEADKKGRARPTGDGAVLSSQALVTRLT